jgi:GT2 family glycosyltransferase
LNSVSALAFTELAPPQDDTPRPGISIVIVNYRSADEVIACLASLYRQDHGRPIEVIVVDNASGDGGPERIKAAFPAARVLLMRHNVGFGAGNNAGLTVARGEFLLLLNPDTEMPDAVLRTVVERLETEPAIGMIGVPQDIGGGAMLSGALRFKEPVSFLLRAVLPAAIVGRIVPRHGNRYEDRGVREEFDCDAVVGCFMATRRDVLAASGAFDDRIFMYAEELELCHRVRRAGYRVLHMGALSVIHNHGATTRGIPVWRDVQVQQGQLVYIRLTQGVAAARRAAAAMSVSHLLRLPIELLRVGPLWRARLESRLKRLQRSLRAIVDPPERTQQSID